MPYKKRDIEKVYFSIGEVAKMFGVNASLIRFYEKEFEFLNPKKSKKGSRMFNREDIEHFKIIFHLIKEKGLTLQGAKTQLSENKNQLLDTQKTIATLTNIQSFLIKLRKQL